MARHYRLIGLALYLLTAVAGAQSPVVVQIRVADISHPLFEATDIRLSLDDSGEQRSLRLEVGRLALPQLGVILEGIVLRCPDSAVPLPRLSCANGVAVVDQSPWGRQRVDLEIDWRDADNWAVGFGGLRHPAGSLHGRVRMEDGQWRLEAHGPALQPARLGELRHRLEGLGIMSVQGSVAADLELRGRGETLRYLAMSIRGRGLGWGDAAGEQAGEGVRLTLSLAARRSGAGWSGAVNLFADAGEVYSDPVFVDLAGQSIRLVADGHWRSGRLTLEKLIVDAGKTLRAQGQGVLRLDPTVPRSLELQAESEELGSLFATWIQPWLLDSPLAELEVKGKGRADLRWASGELAALDVAINDLDVEQSQGRFGITGLTGDLHWVARGDAPNSSLRFDSAHVGVLDLGGGRLRFNSAGRYAYLVEPLELPFYEGRLTVPEATWLVTSEGGEGGFGLRLRNLSFEALTADLGWPEMVGKVNAEIPRARYRDGELRVAGDVVIEAFGGRLVLSDLRLSELGSAAPVLSANLRLRRLDLLQLTRTFSFGEIEGRLDGEVTGLRLVGWVPVRFEARLYSSPDDDRRHRISQRAVENLTELGNGVPGVLSGGFLGLFKTFSYDRIELRVRQRGDRAWIDGIPAPDGGYYLVKGAGIPRIDVIGRNREVAWQDLLARLRDIRVEGMQMR